ncbi:MAG TPA: TAT-variant-translocated molybdopterin oxidoreductase [Pseudomonadota bacterium]|nr:TAT-variant-translocated molybdopterin oxidoreductase [Pseudomonadota bacterium]
MKPTLPKWPGSAPGEKTYWRSTDHAENSPLFRESLNRELPSEVPPEVLNPLSRRSFMGILGASMALAGLSGCRRPEEKILPYTRTPEDLAIGLPTYYATAMPLGSAVYGLLVESHEGRPTKIEGNPNHPMSLGGTNTHTQGAILELYDPDRSAGPLLAGKAEKAPAAAAEAGEHGGGHGGEAPKPVLFGLDAVTDYFKTRRGKWAADKGRGVHVLSGALTSPTLLRLRDQLSKEWTDAKWWTWEPVCEDSIRQGSRTAFGEDLVTLNEVHKASVILSIGSDFVAHTPDGVRNARHFAAKRKVDRPVDDMNRLYVAESAWTVTGTNADHRLRLKPSLLAHFALALALELQKRNLALAPEVVAQLPKAAPAGIDAKFVSAVCEDLLKAQGKALIVVGKSLPAGVHALVHAIHAALGAVGETVNYVKSGDAGRALDRDAIKGLSAALDAGQVETLIVLGGNPVYDAPADLGLAEKLKKVQVVHLGLYRDETALVSALHIPRAHFLESWGDLRAADGTASIVQPLIAPLYKGWSDIELVNYLLTGNMVRGYELVRDTWRGVAAAKFAPPPPPPAPVEAAPVAPAGKGPAGKPVKPVPGAKPVVGVKPAGAAAVVAGAAAPAAPGAAPAAPGAAPADAAAPPPAVPQETLAVFFDRAFRKSLHDGVIEGTAFDKVRPQLKAADIGQAVAQVSAIAPKAWEIEFLISNSTFDGRFANVSWLQELPDPITKIVWDNALLISVEGAKELGVERNDIVSLTVRGQTVEAAVFVVPGQSAGTVALALGYGHNADAVGKVGRGAGFNAYKIRHSDGLWSDEVQVQKTGKKYEDPRDYWFGDTTHLTGLVTTQDHFAMEGRPLVQEATLGKFRKHPNFAQHAVHHPPLLALWDPYKRSGQQWGLVIDLSACVGCGTCTIACQAENNVPVVGKPQVRKGREMHWIRIDRYFTFEPVAFDNVNRKKIELGDDNAQMIHQPVPCMQCEDAPCENVCPVAATTHTQDGLNDMVYNRCVGTRYCANNCPWKVRRFNYLDYRGDVPEVAKLAMNPDVTVRSRGVIEKCTYCVQRIRGAQRSAKLKDTQGRSEYVADGTIVTACQQACPADAITFGDITDQKSKIAVVRQSPRHYAMLEELNAKPRTTYLARIRNPNPALEPEAHEEAHGGGHESAAGHAAAPAGHAPAGEHKTHETGATHP